VSDQPKFPRRAARHLTTSRNRPRASEKRGLPLCDISQWWWILASRMERYVRYCHSRSDLCQRERWGFNDYALSLSLSVVKGFLFFLFSFFLFVKDSVSGIHLHYENRLSRREMECVFPVFSLPVVKGFPLPKDGEIRHHHSRNDLCRPTRDEVSLSSITVLSRRCRRVFLFPRNSMFGYSFKSSKQHIAGERWTCVPTCFSRR
jgi:hypothetical protein